MSRSSILPVNSSKPNHHPVPPFNPVSPRLERLIYIGAALLLFGLPFHLALKLVTENRFVFAWKEVLQMTLVGLTFFAAVARRDIRWILVFGFVGFLTALFYYFYRIGGGIMPTIEGWLLCFGGLGVAYMIANGSGQIFDPRNARVFNFLFYGLAACLLIFTAGLFLNERLNLTFVFAPEQEEVMHWYARREGIDRARFTMDSPMAAGQYVWFASSALLAMAMTRMQTRLKLMVAVVLLGLASIAVLTTGSRGALVLVVATQAIFWGLHAIFGNKTARLILLCVPVVVVLGLGVLRFAVAEETRDAYWTIMSSTFDTTESANVQRYNRVMEGLEESEKVWPRGYGISTLPIKYGIMEVNFENHFLGLLTALGMSGALLIIFQIGLMGWGAVRSIQLLFRGFDEIAVIFLAVALPLLAYMFVFPVGQERYSSILLWVVLGLALALGRPWPGKVIMQRRASKRMP